MIAIDTVREAAFQIMSKAGIEIPEDYQQGIQKMTGSETGPLSCFVLESMLQNWNVANEDRRPMCADTGVPRYAFDGERDALTKWAEKRGHDGLEAYKPENNRKSLDGLPGLVRA